MIRSFQSLRFLFALMIFLHHSAFNLPAFGAFPVSFFLILSGFVLMKGYGNRMESNSKISFIMKRIARLYPTHLLCLVIALIVGVYVSRPINWINTIPGFFMLQAWFPSSDVYFAGNSVSWYVSVCVCCYVMFPSLARAIKKAPNRIMIISVSFYLVSCILIPLEFQHAFLYINPLFRVVDFILGMWLFEVLRSNHGQRIIRKVVVLSDWSRLSLEIMSIIFSFLFIGLSLVIDNVICFAALWWLPSLSIIATFYIMDQNPSFITKILQNKLLVSFGSISYAFYLLHLSILVINNKIVESHPINYVLDGFIVLAIVMVLAYIVTYYFEPLFTYKKRTANEKM